MIKKSLLFGLAVTALALAAPVMLEAARTDTPLTDVYYSLPGLDGREGVCTNAYVGSGTDNDTGMVGVSQYVNLDEVLAMRGTIQPTFDDARTSECARLPQVYTIVDRTHQSFPGLTNYFFGLRLNDLCAGGTLDTCQYSTMYAAPVMPSGVSNPTELSVDERLNIGTRFPDTLGSWIEVRGITPPDFGDITSNYFAYVPGAYIEDDDHIIINQTVYQPENKPYFDITWEIFTTKKTFNHVNFVQVADTFTGGNDYGYGYLCDVCKIAGGTGGSAFFQGIIAMHPSEKQYEGWWADVFYRAKNNTLPELTKWSEPMAVDPSSGQKEIPLTSLEDNAVAHEWTDLTISPKSTFISARWTFDDPILQSSYGSVRSLFTVTSDNMTYVDTDGTTKKAQPSLFDIRYNPRYWRGQVFTYKLPKACERNEDCQSDGSVEQCIPSAECAGEVDCPKSCAVSTCDTTCGSGQSCVFGFCVVGNTWKTEAISGNEANRTLFTYKPDGTRIILKPDDMGVAAVLNQQFQLPTTKDAMYLTNWIMGTLYERDAADSDGYKRVISSNETTTVNLHRPYDLTAYETETPIIVSMLRERYGCTTEACTLDEDHQCDEDTCSVKDNWLLGDVAHADPVYIGSRPSNSWADVGTKPYSKFINTEEYQTRKPVLLVSANDGMLHCFDASTGAELWAFIPWDVLPKMVELSKPFYEQVRSPVMDLRPIVHDVYEESTGNWHSVLLVGSRGGGTTYWTLDITPPMGHLAPTDAASDRVKLMWYYEDEDMGLTYSVPTTGRFKTGTSADPNSPPPSKWLAFFGSGYAQHSAAQMQKEGYFYVVDMFDTESGTYKATTISKIRISKADTRLYGMGAEETYIRNNILSSATVADPDADGYEEVVYIGDLAGHLLRFNIAIPVDDSSITGQVLFNTFRIPPSSGGGSEEPLTAFLQKVENLRLASSGGGTTDSQTYEFYKYPRPITVRPVVWRTTDINDTETTSFLGESDNKNKLMVFFGTGKYDAFYDSFDEYKRNPNASDCQTWPYSSSCVRDLQEMFAVIDYQQNGDDARVKYADLLPNHVEDSTISGDNGEVMVRKVVSEDDPENGWRGWHLLFNSTYGENRGEKVITEPVVWEQENMFRSQGSERKKDWILFFTTFTPNMQGTCDIRTADDAGGGFLMTISAETGNNPRFAIQDVTGNQLLTTSDQITAGDAAGWAGQKFTGSILSRVDVDPYSKTIYVKTGPDNPVQSIRVAGSPALEGARTTLYRIR